MAGSTVQTLTAPPAPSDLSAKERTEHYLERIAAVDGQVGAFIEVYADRARAAAARADELIASGQATPLTGKVIGLKDVLSDAGYGLGASSRILEGFKAQFTATAVERLEAAGAVIIGRQSCDEFAMGSSNERSVHGPVHNPHDLGRVPGGSSGASAAALAAGLCDLSIGSDTGGSVRQPAAFCGVYGLKPTYGRISRWGLAAYASSFDCIGPMGHSLEELAAALAVMAGPDDHDATVSRKPVDDYRSFAETAQGRTAPLRIGVLEQSLGGHGVEPAVGASLERAIEGLRAQGHQIETYQASMLDYLLPTYYILTTAEASANLARYDGIRYGRRAEGAASLEELYKRTRAEGFGPEVRRRILIGTFVLSARYYDAFYTRAQKARRLIFDEARSLMGRYDVLLSATTPGTAFAIGARDQDPIQMYLADIFTVTANLTGQPSLSIPAGHDGMGLPIGLQLTGSWMGERALLAAAHTLEEVLAG